MKNYSKQILSEIIRKYNSVIQTKALLADPKNLIGELGRGSGKTREILAPRLIRIANAMPRSILALGGPTYKFVVDSISEGILTYLNTYYIKGYHFEYGKEPPPFFNRPFTQINDWKHTISLPCGTVVKFAGVDRPNTSLVGQNVAHILIDELLRINETNFRERLMPAKRGDRAIHGKSHFFGGITGFSSTPNLENDHDWWLSFEDNMDLALIEEIMYVALRVSQSLAQVELWSQEKDLAIKDANWEFIKKVDSKIEKKLRFVAKWETKLNDKRKGATYYMKGTSFTNLAILGLDYFKEQYDGNKGNIDKFKLSMLGVRPNKVRSPFFSKFGQHNIFDDSYTYNHIDTYAIDGNREKTSRDLKYCDSNMPLLMGLDPGNFMSCIFGQQKNISNTKELRVFKNMWVIGPDEEHFELAQKINEYFKYHNSKTIYLHYDRAGNQKKDKYKDNPKGTTDAFIIKTHLKDLGWEVHLMSLDQRTIFFWEHFFLQARLFGEKEAKVPRVKICQNECEELISSIQMSPKKKSDSVFIELDKSAEKRLDPEDQVYWSPQIATSMMYLLWGLFEKYLPDAKPEEVDFEGL